MFKIFIGKPTPFPDGRAGWCSFVISVSQDGGKVEKTQQHLGDKPYKKRQCQTHSPVKPPSTQYTTC